MCVCVCMCVYYVYSPVHFSLYVMLRVYLFTGTPFPIHLHLIIIYGPITNLWFLEVKFLSHSISHTYTALSLCDCPSIVDKSSNMARHYTLYEHMHPYLIAIICTWIIVSHFENFSNSLRIGHSFFHTFALFCGFWSIE